MLWPADLPQSDKLSADEKKMFARQAEVFAAYVAYADYEIGRVIQAVEDMGKLDDTLIIYIEGDNGTSGEGTTIGTLPPGWKFRIKTHARARATAELAPAGAEPDRAVLPIAEPAYPPITELDARKAKAPPIRRCRSSTSGTRSADGSFTAVPRSSTPTRTGVTIPSSMSTSTATMVPAS